MTILNISHGLGWKCVQYQEKTIQTEWGEGGGTWSAFEKYPQTLYSNVKKFVIDRKLIKKLILLKNCKFAKYEKNLGKLFMTCCNVSLKAAKEITSKVFICKWNWSVQKYKYTSTCLFYFLRTSVPVYLPSFILPFLS